LVLVAGTCRENRANGVAGAGGICRNEITSRAAGNQSADTIRSGSWSSQLVLAACADRVEVADTVRNGSGSKRLELAEGAESQELANTIAGGCGSSNLELVGLASTNVSASTISAGCRWRILVLG